MKPRMLAAVGGAAARPGHGDTGSTRRACSHRAGVLCLLTLAVAAGCSPGMRWEVDSYQRVLEESRAKNKLTFVYFRNWYSVACTKFEENVLKDSAVLAETADLNCVPLDFDWDRKLAEQWGVAAAPAVVIVDPDERILAARFGEILRDDLLQSIRQAKQHQTALAPMSGSP